ncbi:MAG: hypothetical protein DMG82_16850, partial [Acidobacteria bacterium]
MTIVQLRPCRPEDLNQLVEIENLCFAEAKRFDRAYLHTCMTTMPFLIAEIEGLVAGFVICNVRNAQEAYLESLNVHPSFRRQRVASRNSYGGARAERTSRTQKRPNSPNHSNTETKKCLGRLKRSRLFT